MREFSRRAAASLLFVGVILFGAAGRIDWVEAWI